MFLNFSLFKLDLLLFTAKSVLDLQLDNKKVLNLHKNYIGIHIYQARSHKKKDKSLKLF